MPPIRLLITDAQADFLADALEAAIQDAHEETCEFPAGSEEYVAAVDTIKSLGVVLQQFDPENPIFDAEAEPGMKFDWDAFWCASEAEDDDTDDESGEVSDPETLAPAKRLRVV